MSQSIMVSCTCSHTKLCPVCLGIRKRTRPCLVCRGSGKHKVVEGSVSRLVKCGACAVGRVVVSDEPCLTCDGTGRVCTDCAGKKTLPINALAQFWPSQELAVR